MSWGGSERTAFHRYFHGKYGRLWAVLMSFFQHLDSVSIHGVKNLGEWYYAMHLLKPPGISMLLPSQYNGVCGKEPSPTRDLVFETQPGPWIGAPFITFYCLSTRMSGHIPGHLQSRAVCSRTEFLGLGWDCHRFNVDSSVFFYVCGLVLSPVGLCSLQYGVGDCEKIKTFSIQKE